MLNAKSIILCIVAIITLIGVSWLFSTQDNGQAHIAVDPAFVDFGEIDREGGPVSRTISVQNTGNAPLVFHRVSTSCGCTTAEMDLSDLYPGEQRSLRVQFDPMVHPDQLGPITRVVYIQSSDEDAPEFEIDIAGTVITNQ